MTNHPQPLLQLATLSGSSEVDRLKSALPLTEQEADVLLRLAKGKTNREIGIILEYEPAHRQ